MSGLDALVEEANRQFTLCNACRYCEGYCAAFPAMELRTAFGAGDISYLANLCYDCRACYQACPFTDPHEFAINIPALMSEGRLRTYERYARPGWLRRGFTSGPVVLTGLTAGALAVMFGLYLALAGVSSLGTTHTGPGSFYAAVSHMAMVVPALLLTAFGFLAAGIGLLAFWRDSGGRGRDLGNLALWLTALREVATLRWMRGGGGDCYYPEEQHPSSVRRWMHHLVAYGFLATFAATVVAWVQETFFGSQPPYTVASAPVLLGLGGGIAIVAGCLGLVALRMRASHRLSAPAARRLDAGFVLVLLSVGVSGSALLAFRDSVAMRPLLLVHLASIVVLYLTAPYGKLIHAVYRIGATMRSAQERQR